MFSYSLKTGFKNLGAKKLFSLASIGTIACSVLIFCIFYIIVQNIRATIDNLETTVGIEIFFDENLSEEEIINIADNNFKTQDVKEIRFKSSEAAWEGFKNEYFGDNLELAEAFTDDNPLAKSASYEVILYDITKQYEYVEFVKNIEGVRQVNYSNVVIDTLTTLNVGISTFSIFLIGLLGVIAIILISNTITVSAEFRKTENNIMKLIGATNYMIRAPFVVEGMLIGFFGGLIPNIIVCGLYNYIINIIMKKAGLISNLLNPIPLNNIMLIMVTTSIGVSVFLCIIVSYFTIRKQVKV